MNHPMTRPVQCVCLAIACLSLSFHPAAAGPYDGNPKLLLHTWPVSGKNPCGQGALADCGTAVVSGSLNTRYFVYLLVARGSLPDISGMEVGISYQYHQPGNMIDHAGVDVFTWTNCATLEFPTPGANQWPRPGGGNLVTWDVTNVCQTGPTAVVGYFYVTSYSSDVLKLIPRPVSGRAAVATCASIEQYLEPGDLGSVAFPGPGCNPCLGPCPEEPPVCAMTPASIDFGNQHLGVWDWRKITVTNDGEGVVQVRASVDSPYYILWDQTDFDLRAYQSRSFRVAYRTIEYGTHSSEVYVGPDCPSIPVTGTVSPPILCSLFPENYNFGSVPIGQSASQRFVLTNTGIVPFSGQIMENCAAFALSGGLSYSLAPGEADTFFVHFTPSQTGYIACSISTGPCGLQVTGTGGEFVPPVCEVTPSVLDFGPVLVGHSATWYFRVRNLSPGCLVIHPDVSCVNFRWVGRGGQMDACNPNFGVPVEIEFAPGEARFYECTVTASGYCSPVILRGEGRLPGVGTLSPDSLGFGPVTLGTFAERIVTLTNTGGLPISGSMDEYCGEFAISGDPTYTLAPGASRQFRIRFLPGEVGDYRCVVDGGPDATVLPCTGIGTDEMPVEQSTWGKIKARF